jgi:hypothetical protein
MLAPVTNRRVFVQVKSSADPRVLRECIDQFNEAQTYDEFFFFFHSSPRSMREYESEDKRINVIGPDKIAELVINAGLTNWLILRRS